MRKTRLFEHLQKNKYLLLLLLIGLIVLLLPTGSGEEESEEPPKSETGFSVTEQEKRLEAQLGKIRGAGRVSVLLSTDSNGERQLAVNGEDTLVISSGKGEEVVDIDYVNPEYTGAVIVCDGASSPVVKLEVTNAVRVFTGLASDRVFVIQMEQ